MLASDRNFVNSEIFCASDKCFHRNNCELTISQYFFSYLVCNLHYNISSLLCYVLLNINQFMDHMSDVDEFVRASMCYMCFFLPCISTCLQTCWMISKIHLITKVAFGNDTPQSLDSKWHYIPHKINFFCRLWFFAICWILSMICCGNGYNCWLLLSDLWLFH